MEKSGIVQLVLNVAAAREEAKLGRGLKGAKRERLLGIPKLEDANLAGTKKGAAACTIILTEGDSAKSLALNLSERIVPVWNSQVHDHQSEVVSE